MLNSGSFKEISKLVDKTRGVKEDLLPKDFDEKSAEVYFTGGDIVHNWYKQRPYAFKFTDKDGKTSTFYLPISPSNINITTHFATNVIPTMYGTVEEHSEQRYFDITISGTTGMSPRFYTTATGQTKASLRDKVGTEIGRASFTVNTFGLGGFFKRTQQLIQNTINQVTDLFGDPNGTTGIDLNKTGYVAFHNFYKFLLIYKKDAAGEYGSGSNTRAPLLFVNYKDNNQYNVAIQNFQLTRDASQPMLYNYNITMRAYNLKTADEPDTNIDLGSRAAELGLDGIKTSLFAQVANKARQAKNAAYSAIAAAKGFGS
jgi:hypothetical protein